MGTGECRIEAVEANVGTDVIENVSIAKILIQPIKGFRFFRRIRPCAKAFKRGSDGEVNPGGTDAAAGNH